MSHENSTQAADKKNSSEQSPGKLLRLGRERASLSQEQVAKELYMTLTKVRALENDEYERMNSNTFARGYVRAYANLVNLDVECVLAAYDTAAQRTGLTQEYVAPKPNAGNVPIGRFVVLIAAALTVLWLISMWFFDNRQAPVYQVSQPVVEPQVSIASMHSQNSSVESVLSTENMDEMSLEDVVATDIASPVNSAAADVMHFSFKGECWVEVSDANGDVLATDLQSAGSQLTVTGRAPFDVKLGNAPVVEMSLNGKNISIVPSLGTDVLTIKVSK